MSLNPNRVSGPSIPGTAFDTSGGNWSTPNNAKVEDAAVAFDGGVGPGGGGHFAQPLELTNYGFSLPAAAVIDGIKLEAKVSCPGGFDSSIYIKSNLQTSNSTPNFGQFWGTSLNWLTWGGPTSLWGRVWTPAEINNAAFGAGLCAFPGTGTQTSSIDAVRITVFWHYDNTVAAAEVPQRYDYKIYDPAGNFLGNCPGVVSPFGTTQALNSTGAQLKMQVGGTPDGQVPSLALGNLRRWLNPAFKYRKRIRIAAGVVTGTISNMPVMVNLSDMGQHFWSNVDSTGKDIRVTDQYGQQESAIEVVSIDNVGKTGLLWFKAGSLSATFDNDFYLYYGNASAVAYAVTAPLGRNGVWSDYGAVFHLDETANTTAGGYQNANGGLNGTGVSMSQAAVTGKILGKAADFDGVDDQITAASVYGIGTANLSLSGWANITSTNQHGAWLKIGSSGNGYGIGQGDGTSMSGNGGQIMMLYEAVRWMATGYFVNLGWLHWYFTVDASGVPRLYINGALINSYAGAAPIQPTTQTLIGGDTNGSRWDNDPVDEVRIAPKLIGAAQIAAEYKNQNTPNSFYAVASNFETQTVSDGSTTLLRNGNLVNVFETSFYYPNGKLKYQGQINRLEGSFAPEINGLINVICHSDGRDMDNMVARGVPFSFTGDVSQTSQNTTVNNNSGGGKFSGWDRFGQTWTTGGAVTSLGRIQLLLLGTAHVTVNVYASPGLGGGLLGSTTVFVSVGGATVIDFPFPDLITVTPSTSYFFETLVDAGESITMYCSNANPYGSGQMYESVYSGGSGGGGYGAVSGYDLYFTTAAGTPGSLATYTSVDPTTGMLVSVMNDYISRAGNIGYTSGVDIDATGLSLSASFNTNTIYEVLDKILSMSPNGFYYYVDVALNKLRFKRTGLTADWLLIKGRHIEELDLAFSIENVINEERFSGGTVSNGPPPVNFYSKYTDQTSKALYGVRLNRKSDNRVTIQGTADAIGSSDLAQFKDEQYYTTVTVLARTMNITDIKLGQLVGTRGYGSYLDLMLLQITKIDYLPERAVLQLGTLPLRFNQGFEDVIRGLVAEQTIGNPSTPS